MLYRVIFYTRALLLKTGEVNHRIGAKNNHFARVSFVRPPSDVSTVYYVIHLRSVNFGLFLSKLKTPGHYQSLAEAATLTGCDVVRVAISVFFFFFL